MLKKKQNNTGLVVMVVAAIFLIAVFTVWPKARTFALTVIEKPLSLFIGEPKPPIEGSLAHLLDMEARIALLEEENVLLKRSQLISGTTELKSTLGRVLWYDPNPTRHSVRVSLPKFHNVRIGDAAVAPGKVFIGLVERVGSISADVLLLDDPKFQISAETDTTDGILVGFGGGSLRLTLIPSEDVPDMGSAVRTAGKEEQIPKGLLIGTISVGRSRLGDPFAQLSVVPAAPINTLSALSIITTEEI